eukprot:symbB.v1.2.010054.t2/scaffold636.1/size252712/9
MRALVPWLPWFFPWFQVASIEVAPPFAEACDGPEGMACEAWDRVASSWRYAWNNLRLSLHHATARHRLRLDPGEVQQLVAVHEFMLEFLGTWDGAEDRDHDDDGEEEAGRKDKQKWQVGWEEMSGSARALLRGLQLWLVPGEYQQLGLPPGSLTYPVKNIPSPKGKDRLPTTVTSGDDDWS